MVALRSMWDGIRGWLKAHWPFGRSDRELAVRRITMEQRMTDWGRTVEVDGEPVSAWRAGRVAPVEVRSFDGRRR